MKCYKINSFQAIQRHQRKAMEDHYLQVQRQRFLQDLQPQVGDQAFH